MIRQARRLRLQQTAASLAFLSLFAAVPVFSIACSVLATLPLFSRLQDALRDFLAHQLFPEEFSATVLQYLTEFASRAQGLSVAGAVIFFMAAITALQMIERTMNAVWYSRRRRPFLKRVVLYWTFLTLGPLAVTGVLAVNGHLVAEFLSGRELAWLRSIWAIAVPWLVGVGVLLLMFHSLPAARVRVSHALAGAVLAITLLSGLQRLLGWAVRELHAYEVVYGALAVLPLLLVWLFAAWGSVLSGAVFAASLLRWDAPLEDPEPDYAPGRRFEDALTVLGALRAAGSANAGAAIMVEELRTAFDSDAQRLELAGELLEELGYVCRFVSVSGAAVLPAATRLGLSRAAGGPGESDKHRLAEARRGTIWNERWAWMRSPETLTLRPLFDALWWDGHPGSVQSWQGAELDRPLSRMPGP